MTGAETGEVEMGVEEMAFARPWLKPWYKVVLDGDQCVLHYGGSVAVLEGKAVARLLPVLLPLLDGLHSVEQIIDELGEPFAPAVENALAILEEHDLLAEGPPPDPGSPPVAEAYEFLAATSFEGMSPSEVAAALERGHVEVLGGGRPAARISELLLSSGVKSLSQRPLDGGAKPEEGSFTLVVPTPAEAPHLEAWNKNALETGTPWLQVTPFDGVFTAIGPLFVPGETCCYECYRRRRADNVEFVEEFWKLEDVAGKYPAAPALVAAVAGLATTFVLRWLTERDFFLPGRFYALEAQGEWKLTTHTVHRVPRCPVCSQAAGVAQPMPWHS